MQISSWLHRLPLMLLGFSILNMVGCTSCDQCRSTYPFWKYHDHCADIPRGAIPQPAGTFSGQWHATQAAAAEVEQLTIYQADWRAQSDQLGPFGQRRLEQMAEQLQTCPNPIVIERSDSYDLDESRRQTVLVALAERGIANPLERVVVGYSSAYSLYGLEAKGIARSALERSTSTNTSQAPFSGVSNQLQSSAQGGY